MMAVVMIMGEVMIIDQFLRILIDSYGNSQTSPRSVFPELTLLLGW